MTSPSMFVVSVACILNNWVSGWFCSTLGVSPYLWVAGVMPSFVVFNMCDRIKLKKAVSDLGGVIIDLGTLAKFVGVALMALAGVYFEFLPWVFLIMAGFAYFVLTSFSHERALYVGDSCGAIAKELCRKVISNFVTESTRMKMKGEWTFCSPYSRRLVHKSTDHYYTLTEEICEIAHPCNTFTIAFDIEDCRVVCKHEYLGEYKNGTEQKWHTNRVEVSLFYEEEALEEFTYFYIPVQRVAKLKYLLEILQNQDEGNLVFSSFHRNVGSESKRAHARCYEFEEMLELVLRKGWTLKRINLSAQYACNISGSSFPHGIAAGLLLGLSCCLLSIM